MAASLPVSTILVSYKPPLDARNSRRKQERVKKNKTTYTTINSHPGPPSTLDLTWLELRPVNQHPESMIDVIHNDDRVVPRSGLEYEPGKAAEGTSSGHSTVTLKEMRQGLKAISPGCPGVNDIEGKISKILQPLKPTMGPKPLDVGHAMRTRPSTEDGQMPAVSVL